MTKTVKQVRAMDATPEIPSHADTIVIGGGTAGAAIAARLAEKAEQSVLLIEAGPDYGTLKEGRWPPDLLDGRVVNNTHDWGYINDGQTGQPGHTLNRAKVIGGCSSHNGSISLRGSYADYDGWESNGNAGWSTKAVLPFFTKAESALRIRNFEPAELSPFHTACRTAIALSGIPKVTDLNDLYQDEGVGFAPVNIQNDIRWNTALAYLDPFRTSGYLTILGEALVKKVRMKGNRPTAVEIIFRKHVFQVETERVVVCAGTYGSPSILLRSGIGPQEDLKSLGIVTNMNMPGVGNNLHDHVSIKLKYPGTGHLSSLMERFPSIFTEQSIAKIRSSHCKEAFDLHIYPTSALQSNNDGRWECILSVANMAPKSRGKLMLRSADPQAIPFIDTGYLTDQGDLDLNVLSDGVTLTREIANRPELKTLIGQESAESANIRNVDSLKQSCFHYYHPVGTCKMGPVSDAMAVVDANGLLHGAHNFYIADASIMPVIPRANTNLPTLMLAERFAAGID